MAAEQEAKDGKPTIALAWTMHQIGRLIASQTGRDGVHRRIEAEAYHRRAAAIYDALSPDSINAALNLESLAETIYLQNPTRLAEARPFVERTFEIRKARLGANDPLTLESMKKLADYLEGEEGLKLLRTYVALVEKAHGPGSSQASRAGRTLSDTLQSQDRFAEADRVLLSLISAAESKGRIDFDLVFGRVRNLQAQGRTAEAERLLRELLPRIQDAVGAEHSNMATALSFLASAIEAREGPLAGEHLRRRALAITEKVNSSTGRATAAALKSLATSIEADGRYVEAEAMLRRAINIMERRTGAQGLDVKWVKADLARNLERQGRQEEAEELFRAASETVGGDFDRSTFGAKIGSDFGAFLAKTGRSEEAGELLQKSLTLQRSSLPGFHSDRLSTEGRLAEVMLTNGKPAESIKLLRTARSGMASPAFGNADRGKFGLGWVHMLFPDAAWAQSRLKPGDNAGLGRESFAAAQDAAGSSASAALAQMSARFAAGTDALAGVVRQRQDLEGSLRANDKMLVDALGRADAAAAAAARARTEGLSTRLKTLDSQIATRFPQYASLVSPSPVAVAQVQGLLRPEEALLFMAPGPRGTHVFAVSRNGFQWTRSDLTADQVAAMVRALRCSANDTTCAPNPAVLPQQPSKDAAAAPTTAGDGTRARPRERVPVEFGRPSFDRARAYRLYQALVAPAEAVIAGKSELLIVAGGALGSLPFSLLVTAPPAGADDDPGSLRETPWLIDRFALTTLPSIGSLRALRTFTGRSSVAGSFQGFGDPVLPAPVLTRGAKASDARGPSATPLALFRNAGHTDAGAPMADPQAIRLSFYALPKTREELHALRAAFKAPDSALWLGERATEAAVKTADLRGVRVVAFATHGVLAGDIGGFAEPGLIFTPPKAASSLDDGVLSASEAAQLQLSADWVILSACNTAAPDGALDTEGLSGLARSFFYAGARALLVSHWPVRDDVAARLTVDTVIRQQADPAISRAQALRASIIAARNDPSRDWAHPGVWAPFVLVGEPRAQ
ncbi:CHAT domain-containing tetratricopeptide repeat protein [Phenylobacterium sp.]|uniref:CHAT domain-containing tetratricopeptide repeat protein n=1 Tax=Phenylobacterium sp. TaxID=1871053 RepID=UPI00286AB426|nr:CHAT domain-containing tetratricopeptide repeat protein [Phenylobacterium sp.]